MNYFFKYLLLTLISAIAFNSSFAQDTINLTLDCTGHINDPGDRYVHTGDMVTWRIKDSRIEKFQIKGANQPFNQLTDSFVNSISGTVRKDAKGTLWKYNINYKVSGVNGTQHLDPKISVDPTGPGFLNIIVDIALAVTAGLAMLFAVLWRKTVAKLRAVPRRQ